LAERWEDLIEQVRQFKGFETFLEAPRCRSLHQAARDGPIVVINVSEYRTDALIVTGPGQIRCIPLKGLSDKVISGLAYTWHQALKCTKDREGSIYMNRVLQSISRRLWDGGFSQIAAALQEIRDSRHSRSAFRVWLMPTGMLSLLPIHCAGPCQSDQLGMYDFVTSYTGTLSCLILSRSGGGCTSSSAGDGTRHRLLAVAQPKVDNFPVLQGAEREIDALLDSPFSENMTYLSEAEATVSRFAEELPQHEWLHCCSHATWNSTNPLDSAFCLKDGKLTLSCIVRLRMWNAQFAFLSACHTARQTSLLPDESMHLTAGMQVSGFRSLVATQWAMADQDGPVLTRMFYDYLMKDGRAPDVRNTAESLHLALRQFRLRNIPMYRWALFVHAGV
ncbi:hypothetical protein DACRYDRAFT_43334, partial [Dacryopinax primogenitus]